MKRLLLSLLTLFTIQAYAVVMIEETRVFDFKTLESLKQMIPFSQYDLYQLEHAQNANSISVNPYTISVDPVTINTSKGQGNGGGGQIKYYDGEEESRFVLVITAGGDMTVRAPEGCILKQISMTYGGTLNVQPGDPGYISNSSRAWYPNDGEKTSYAVISNSWMDAEIYNMTVRYERPATALLFVSSNPTGSTSHSTTTLPTFSSMTVNYDAYITSVDYSKPVTISGPAFDTEQSMSVSKSGSQVTLSISPEITKDGTYTITIPEGKFFNQEGGTNAEKTISFDVYAERQTITEWTADPSEDGIYNVLPQVIKLTFPDAVKVDNTKIGVLSLVPKDGGSQGPYPVTFAVDPEDSKSVLLTNSYGDIITDGTHTISIPEGAIHNLFFDVSDEYDRWNPAFTLTYTIVRPEKDAVRKAQSLLDLSGIGYPTETSTARTELQAMVITYTANPAAWTEEQTTELNTKIDNFYASTEVMLPEADKWYRIIGINGAATASAQKVYLYFRQGGVELTTTSSYDNGTKFKVKDNGDGTLTFITSDESHYLTVLSDKNYSQATTKNVKEAEGDATKLTLAKLNVEGKDAELMLGKLTMTGWLGRDGNDQDMGNSTAAINYGWAPTVAATPTSTIYFDTTTSSAFIFEETTAPSQEATYVDPTVTSYPDPTVLDTPSTGFTITIGNVKSASLQNGSYAVFLKNGSAVSTNGDILTKTGACTFSVNTSLLSDAGDYSLVMPEGTFTFVPTDEDAANGKQVRDMDLTVYFTINNDGPKPTPSFKQDYPECGGAENMVFGASSRTWAYDYELNDLTLISTVPIYADPTKTVVLSPKYNTTPAYTGHFEPYDFADLLARIPEDKHALFYGYSYCIKLKLDKEIAEGELASHYGSMFEYEIPEATYGDENFAKYIGVLPLGPGESKPAAEDCSVNRKNSDIWYQVSNTKADAEQTAISNIAVDGAAGQVIYDLQGRRITTPAKKGVYIINGKKVVMK